MEILENQFILLLEYATGQLNVDITILHGNILQIIPNCGKVDPESISLNLIITL
jgi:hypothetical protein